MNSSQSRRPCAAHELADSQAACSDDTWRAGIELAYERRGARTVPAVRRHYGPLRVQRGLLPEGPGLWHQILVHPPGGIASGDSLEIAVTAHTGAQVLLTSPGATRWYRARRPASSLPDGAIWANQSLCLRVEAGASLEWLPLEAIVFDGARAQWRSRFEVAPGASLVAAELLCLGEPASGRRYAQGGLRWRTEIRRGDRLLFGEQARLAGGDRLFESPAGLAGYPAFGTLFAVAADPAADLLPALRRIEAPGECAVTRIDELTMVRWRGGSAEQGWQALRAAWTILRPALVGREAVAPRIWAT